jgi:hypothetical protein
MARALVAHPTCLSSMNGCIWVLCFLKETPLFSFMWFFLTKKENNQKVVRIVHEKYMTFETMLMLLDNCNFIHYMCGFVFARAIRLSK